MKTIASIWLVVVSILLAMTVSCGSAGSRPSASGPQPPAGSYTKPAPVGGADLELKLAQGHYTVNVG